MIARPIPFGLLLLGLAGCGKLADSVFCASAGCDWKPGEWERIAALANPSPPPPDLSNALSGDPAAVQLGRTFFFDPAFSGTATQKDAIKRDSPPARAAKNARIDISCATCHDLTRAGVDTTSVPGHVSVGAGWTDVNALPVVNSAYRQVVFWNGRADSLWALNAVVAESSTTLNGNRLRTAHQIFDRYGPQPLFMNQIRKQLPLLGCDALNALYASIAGMPADGKPNGMSGCQADDPNDVFDCQLSADQQTLVTTLMVIWAKAIAAYEETLVSGPSPFDRFVTEGPGSTAISGAAQRGARLFVGKAACVDCHSGPQLTDEQFHDIGIPQTGLAVPTTADCPADSPNGCDCVKGIGCAPWGVYEGLKRLKGTAEKPNAWLRSGRWADLDTFGQPDPSRQAYVDRPLTPALQGQWRTPSLRNVAQTAPYMHDGRYATLQDVVWHYNTGGKNAGPEQIGVLAAQIKPLMLSDAEQSDLVAFLESLTGTPPDDALMAPPTPPAQGPPFVMLPGCLLPPKGTGGSGVTGAGGSGGGPSGTAGVGGPGTGGTGIGAVGGSMATGSGGGPGLLMCNGAAPRVPLITDFEDAVQVGPGAPVIFGMAPRLTGRAFAGASPGVAPPRLSLASSSTRALYVARPSNATPMSSSDFYEFGLLFDDCVDGRGFQAIQFTATNNMPACQVQFSVISRQSISRTQDPRGACPTSCDPPTTLITLDGVLHVPFTGGPSPFVDPASIIGLRWRVPDSCGIAVSIDDIMFVNP